MATDRLAIRTSISPESRSSRNQGPVQPAPRGPDRHFAKGYDTYDEYVQGQGLLSANGHAHTHSHHHKRSMGRRDSRNESLPDTPPYHGSDMSTRPSLPPLKTLFGDNFASPPATPDTTKMTVQPFPCEPSVSADTYKPIAFYPNKKQRTTFRLEPVAPIGNNGYYNSPTLPQPLFDESPRRRPANELNGCPADSSERSRSHALMSDRRERVVPSEPNGDYTPNPYRVGLPSVPPHPSPQPYHRRRAYNQMEDERDTIHLQRQEHSPRRPSYSQFHYDRPSNRYDPSPEPPASYMDDRGELPRPRRDDYYRYPREVFNGASPRQIPASRHPSSSHFVTNHYDHPHSKSRKRSNLPKQSTEIMRQWFEQNISNPYPTEEQKAIFSQATGISMTQVSNWFINHRRRCPQLKDKRDRNRDTMQCD